MQYLKKEVIHDSLLTDKHESLLRINFKILMGFVKHCQNSKFAVSFLYLKKEVRDGVDFFEEDIDDAIKKKSFLEAV